MSQILYSSSIKAKFFLFILQETQSRILTGSCSSW